MLRLQITFVTSTGMYEEYSMDVKDDMYYVLLYFSV